MALFIDENKIKSIQMANLSLVPPAAFNFDNNISSAAIINKPIIRRKNFSPEEDKLLTDLVCKFGSKKWSTIAQYFQYRTARQCRERYNNYLAPTVFKGQWLQEEDDLLYEKYKEIGPKWSKMKVFFNNRSPNLLKNRWKYFVSKNYPQIQPKKEENDEEDPIIQEDQKIESSNETINKDSSQKVELNEKDNSQDNLKLLYDICVNKQNLFMSLTDFEEIYSFPYLSQVPIQINELKGEDFGKASFDISLF